MVGTVAAIVFGTIGAAITLTKLLWDRRDRRVAGQKEADEAAGVAHEDERRRREEARWQATDESREEGRRLRIYSEAEARQILNQPRPGHPTAGSAAASPARRRSRATVSLGVGVVLILSLLVAAGLLWLILR